MRSMQVRDCRLTHGVISQKEPKGRLCEDPLQKGLRVRSTKPRKKTKGTKKATDSLQKQLWVPKKNTTPRTPKSRKRRRKGRTRIRRIRSKMA